MHSKVPASGTVMRSLCYKKCSGKAACVQESECAHTHIPDILMCLSNVPIYTIYLSDVPIYTSKMPTGLSHMFVVQGEITALRGDVAHLFLALKAAESRHQQELAGVIIDAAQHQTKVSISFSCLSPQQAPVIITMTRNSPFLSWSLHLCLPSLFLVSFLLLLKSCPLLFSASY